MDSKISYNKVKKISGWLGRTDFEIFKELLNAQMHSKTQGAIAEIGVHHGKSSIVMAVFSGNAKLYAIDIFGDQEKNIDSSGRGNKEIFLRNMKRFSIDESRIVIDARLSSEVQAKDIKKSVGSVKFFHIDGGHHLDAILHDIYLASKSLSEGGIIAIDDVFRPEWPEVSIGTFSSEVFRNSDLVCFAIGFNKSYFCHRKYVSLYQKVLKESRFLNAYLTKEYQPRDGVILIYQKYPLPEWGVLTFVLWWLSIYKPEIYVFLRPKLVKLKAKLIRRG
jgi:predicted O-methyltransferase YrrM